MSASNQQKMYDNEHAEYLFANVLSPTRWRGPLEQGRLDACYHLARLVEQLEAYQREDENLRAAVPIYERLRSTQEQLETLEGAHGFLMQKLQEIRRVLDDPYPASRPRPKFPLFSSGRSDISNQESSRDD